MSSNSNLGYTGYLLRKTVQPHSLRYENSNFNEYREKNMIMYINKKVSNTRSREGGNLSHQQLQKGIHLMVRKTNGPQNAMNRENEESSQVQEEVDLEQLKKDEEKERQDPFYQEVIIQMKQNEFSDDFAVVSEENKIGKQSKSKKERSDIDKTLNILVANNLNQNSLQDLFRDYKKISLKDKLNDLKSRHADMAKIQRKIKKDQQKMQDLEDVEKVNKFMGQICASKNLSLGKILQMKDEDIQYTQEIEGLEGIPKVKALEMLQELIEDEEDENQKNMIKIFKKTQLDNIDTDAARNKFNMTSFKKKNEQTEKLYQQMADNKKTALINAYKDPFIDPDKFVRNKDSVKPPSEKVNVFQRLISAEYHKQQEEISKKMPKQLPLGFFQTEQQKCHEQLRNIYIRKNSNISSVPNIYDSKMQQSTKKSTTNLMTQESTAGNHLFITENAYSVPNSTLHKTQPSKLQFGNWTHGSNGSTNSVVFTPQKNMIEMSQMSTDIKTKTVQKPIVKQFNRTSSAKQILVPQNNPLLEDYFMQQTPLVSNPKRTYFQRQSVSMSLFKRDQEPFKIQVQQHLDHLKLRINKLKDNKQFTKANKLQMLVNKLEMQEQVQNFVTDCNKQKQESQKQSSFTNHQINNLENDFEDDLKDINLLQQGQVNVEIKVDNPNFIEFKKRSEFKRKLINYLIQKVDKKTDVLSKYKQKQFTQNFLQKLYDGSITVEQQ